LSAEFPSAVKTDAVQIVGVVGGKMGLRTGTSLIGFGMPQSRTLARRGSICFRWMIPRNA
jgi:hypothetical protein